jgi:hypothetical protein
MVLSEHLDLVMMQAYHTSRILAGNSKGINALCPAKWKMNLDCHFRA